MADIAQLRDALANADKAAQQGVAGAAEDARALADEIVKLSGARSKAYMRGRTEVGGATRGAMSVLNGPTFGFGDELLGAMGGAWDTIRKGGKFTDNYRANRDYVRGAQDVESEDRPFFTGITQAAASMPMTLLKLPGTAAKVAAAPMGVMGQSMRAAGSGAAYGTVGGVGNSTAEDLGGMARDGLRSGAVGAASGGAFTPVARAVGAVGGNVASRFNQSAATRYANEKVAQAIARDADAVAATGDPVDAALARMRSLGPVAVVGDSAGSNTRQLLDTMATLPGRTKEATHNFIENRVNERGARMIQSADQAMGMNGTRLAPTVNALIEQRSKAAKPLYDALRPLVIQEPSPRLQEIVLAAHELGATSLGKKSATARMLPYTLNHEVPFNWKMTDLDNLKRGLDNLIEGEVNPLGRATPLGADLVGLKKALLQELDDLTVEPRTGQSLYKAARDSFAGPSALITAARQGRAALADDAPAIVALTDGMTASELRAFKVGAFEALRNDMGMSDAGRTKILNMSKNLGMREKLKAIFGSEEEFQRFAKTAADEKTMKLLERAGQGSQTAERLFAAGDLDTSALEGAGSAMQGVANGSPMAVLRGGAQVWNKVKTPEAVRDQIGRVLLSGGQDAQANLQAVRETVQKINEARGLAQRNMGLFGGSLGFSSIPQ